MRYRAKAQVNWNWNYQQPAKGPRLKTRLRVLIADDDTTFARRLSDYFWDHGFEAKVAKTISQAKELVEFWQPDTVFVDLLLPETNALSLFKFINTRILKKIPKIAVMSKQALPKGIEQMRKVGASHYLVKPFSLEEALRLALPDEVKERREAQAGPNLTQSPETIKELHLINLFLKQASQGSETNLYNLMRMINLKAKALRTSLIRCLNDKTGAVLASNDNENVQGLKLDLANYPEFLEVKRTRAPLVISNVGTNEVMRPVRDRMKETPYETIVLFPVFRYGDFYGVLSVRLERKEALEIFYVEKFGQVCSQIISLAIADPSRL